MTGQNNHFWEMKKVSADKSSQSSTFFYLLPMPPNAIILEI
jgi:hypothetical protein